MWGLIVSGVFLCNFSCIVINDVFVLCEYICCEVRAISPQDRHVVSERSCWCCDNGTIPDKYTS